MGTGDALVLAAFVLAVADWVAVARRNRRAEYVVKPLTLAVLIAAATVYGRAAGGPRFALTLAALVLSLAGDVFLMMPRDLFIGGLGSFLLAHLAYVGAFNTSPPPLLPTVPAAVAIVAMAGAIFMRMRAGMLRGGRREMVLPVAAYVLAISAMVVSAVATAGRPDWDGGRSAVAIAGALLFFSSDGLIGWTRFVRELPWSGIAIMATYHLAQIALVVALLR